MEDNQIESDNTQIEYISHRDGISKLKTYNQIRSFLNHEKEGERLLNEIASKALRGVYTYGFKPCGWLGDLFFGHAYKEGFKRGFLIGLEEGGKAMETEIQLQDPNK